MTYQSSVITVVGHYSSVRPNIIAIIIAQKQEYL